MYIYTVRPGDTLYQVALRNGIDPQAILAVNSIADPNRLVPGEALIIPVAGGMTTHTVRPGESLWSIAQSEGVPPERLQAANPIPPGALLPGEEVVVPTVTPPARQSVEVNAYVVVAVGELDLPMVTRMVNDLTYISLFDYRYDAAGVITPPPGSAAAAAALRRAGLGPLAVITDFDGTNFSPDLARAVMSDPVRTRAVSNALSVSQAQNLAGVLVDFENMYPADRPQYNTFIRTLTGQLRPAGLLLALAVAPKASDMPDQPWIGAFDYQTLGSLADRVNLMTYEWGWVGGPPRAVAPVNLVEQVVLYALKLMPPEKIWLGIPLYGYDWPLPRREGELAARVSPQGARNLAVERGVDIRYDGLAQSPWFRYTDETGRDHEVWFEDARSILAKFNLIRRYGLRGPSYWTLDTGFTQNWVLQRQYFDVRRFAPAA